jgi:hypothetical protein
LPSGWRKAKSHWRTASNGFNPYLEGVHLAAKRDKLAVKSPARQGSCNFYVALLAADGSGDVSKGAELTKQDAIASRKNDINVVVCGPDPKENRRQAAEVEQATSGVGNYRRHAAHGTAGPNALNHYQAIVPPPDGHCFYETGSQKAK